MKITVLTPAFNRGSELVKLFASLNQQVNLNFEWVIIDDGSQDETGLIVEQFFNNKRFHIDYYYKENGGKHSAVNYGLAKVKNEFCIIVDSDDVLKPNAIDFFLNEINDLGEDIAAISCLTEDEKGNIIGDKFPQSPMEISHIEQVYDYNVLGDKVECYRTEVLIKNPFPVFYGERFLTEAVVWNRIGLKYKKRCYNESLRVSEYHEGGLTCNIVNLHNNSLLGSFIYHYEISNIEALSRKCRLKHRIIAMKFIWMIVFDKVFVSIISIPFGFFLFIRNLINDKYSK